MLPLGNESQALTSPDGEFTPAPDPTPEESLDLLRLLVDRVPGFVAMADLDGRYLLVNRQYLETFGKASSDFLGHHYREVLPEEVWRRHEPWIARCLAGEDVPFEDAIPREGSPPLYVRGVYRPVFGADGRVRFLTVVSMDVTDRVEAEKALRRGEERLTVTLGSIGEGVIATDLDGCIVMMNEAAATLVGWTVTEALGRPLETVFQVDSSDPQETSREQRVGRLTRGLLRARDGTMRPVEQRTSPIRDPDGQMLGTVVVFHDDSERVEQERQRTMLQKLESLAVLAGGIAHDFNNLLTSIQGNLSMVLGQADLSPDVRTCLEDAREASDRAQGLTRQLLTFARGGDPVFRVAEIGPMLRQTATTTAARVPSVTCRVDVAPDLWCLNGDPGQIAQVVRDLLTNAIEASPPGGEVHLHCGNVRLEEDNDAGLTAGPYIRLDVVDHGSGIPDEIRSRVFDPYFSTKSGHSGLGLAVAHSIVHRHGGRIRMEPMPGSGTTFRVLLPAVPDGSQRDRGGRRQDVVVQGSFALVMDDDVGVQRVCERCLSRMGFQVVVAREGGQAIELYREAMARGRRFDIVLLDLTVPGGMGGVQTMDALRRIDPEVRAIVTSGYSEDPVLSRHRDFGFAAVLPKPFSLGDLQQALRMAISPTSEAETG